MLDKTLAMENSLTVPQKAKHKITTWPSNSSPRYIHTKKNSETWTNICTSKCPSIDEWTNKWDIYIYLYVCMYIYI